MSDLFKVGMSASNQRQAVATRDDTTVNKSISYWNASNSKLTSSSDIVTGVVSGMTQGGVGNGTGNSTLSNVLYVEGPNSRRLMIHNDAVNASSNNIAFIAFKPNQNQLTTD